MPKKQRILVDPILEPLVRSLQKLEGQLPGEAYRGFLGSIQQTVEALNRSPQQTEPGEAYYFLRTYTPKGEFEEGLAVVRDVAEVRSDLEVTVFNNLDEIPDDANLRKCSECVTQECYRDEGRPVVLRARLPGATNRQTSSQLGTIIGRLSNWSDINDDPPIELVENAGDRFIKAGGRYIEDNFS